MRATTLSLCLGLILLAGVAAGEEKPAKDVRENCTASAAYVQDDFFRNLKENLAEGFSKSRREKMMGTLGKQGLSSGDVLELMNGSCSDRELRKHLGVSRGDTDRVRAALDETVKEKDKNAFFGIMTEIMIGNFDVDPSGEFAQQACGAKDEISDETMNKILKKANTSRRTMKEAFGFKDKDDQKFMADIIKAAMVSPLLTHPMLKSLGMAKGKSFDKRKFHGKLNEQNAGFGSFTDGTAGGLPVDPKLPPLPYFGESLEQYFGGTANR